MIHRLRTACELYLAIKRKDTICHPQLALGKKQATVPRFVGKTLFTPDEYPYVPMRTHTHYSSITRMYRGPRDKLLVIDTSKHPANFMRTSIDIQFNVMCC